MQNGDEALASNPEKHEGETGPDAPTRDLTAVPTAASGDRCSNCGAPLAHDQRYCVQCGDRRGQSTLPKAQPVTEVRSSSRVRSSRAARPARMSSGATLVAGVGVLLLAIGLGVLIGHYGKSNSTPKASSTPPVTILQQGGGGASTQAATTASTPTSRAPAHVNSNSLTKKAQAKLKATAASKKVQQQATKAAGKVLGNSNNLAPPTATTGSSCSNGQAGCQNGKFTGNFFGGG